MFDLWKLKRARRKAIKYVETTQEGAGRNPEDFDGVKRLMAAMAAVPETTTRIEWFIGDRVYEEALGLDVPIPGFDEPGMWDPIVDGKKPSLAAQGRFHLRKLVDAEKARRFKIKTMWVTNLILPLLATLIGVIGAITGLVAVLHKK